MTVGVCAACTGPDPTGPVLGRGGEGAVCKALEGEAAAFKNGVAAVGLNGGPDSERTVVN